MIKPNSALPGAMSLAAQSIMTRQMPAETGERRAPNMPPESNGRREFPAAFVPSTYDATSHEVDLTLATGAAVQRRWLIEELDMAPEAIDLGRAALNQLRLLFNHNTDDPIGSLFDVRLENGILVARARFADTPRAREIEAQVASGDLAGVSIGYQVRTWTMVQYDIDTEMETWRATAWELLEGSIVPVPADPHAGVRSVSQVASPGAPGDIAAPEEVEDMHTRSVETPASGAAPAAAAPAVATPGLAPIQVQRGLTAVQLLDAQAMARSVGVETNEIDADLRSETATPETVNAAILRAAAARQAATAAPAGSAARAVTDERQVAATGMVDALVSRMTHVAPTEHGRQYRGLSVSDLIADRLGMTGRNSADEVLRRAMHTTSDFPLLLEAAANKVLMEAYGFAAPTYRSLARRRDFADFKPHKYLRIGEFPELLALGESGEIKAGTIAEGRETVSLGTKARMVMLSRQAIVNDDLNAFADLLTAAGRAAARGENAAFWALVKANVQLADSVAMFASGHANLAGSGAAPDVTTLAAGRAALRKQKDIGGLQALNTVARFLVTSPDLETDAEKLTFSINPTATSAVNPFSGRLTPVSDAELTGNAWYMFADPADLPNFIYGYLNGAEGPTITQDRPFGYDGFGLQVVHDFGVGAVDYRGGYKNPGA